MLHLAPLHVTHVVSYRIASYHQTESSIYDIMISISIQRTHSNNNNNGNLKKASYIRKFV